MVRLLLVPVFIVASLLLVANTDGQDKKKGGAAVTGVVVSVDADKDSKDTGSITVKTGEKKDKEKDEATRSVSGTVRGLKDEAVEGAVVQIKDTRTLRVRSYITKADGNYFFHGLSKNSDYELKAEFGGNASGKKTLSVYDSRQNAVINLQLEETKKN